MSLYTKIGDKGQTMLYGGGRISKADPRVHAYGSIDELSAILGVVLAGEQGGKLRSRLLPVQATLYRLGADLATPHQTRSVGAGQAPRDPVAAMRLTETDVREIERAIDEEEARVPPLTHFILPGGTKSAAELHQARTVCRRAERWVATLSEREQVNDASLRYMNRLGDYLFALARVCNSEAGIPEVTLFSSHTHGT